MRKKLSVIYSNEMAVEGVPLLNSSARKPKLMAERLRRAEMDLEFIPPAPLSREDFYRAHDPEFVDGVLDLSEDNGFGNRSEAVARSLPFTSGALYSAALLALQEGVAAALASGFHHAHYARATGFCTFNGLVVTALKLIQERGLERVAILDLDQHYGNGTQDIIDRLDLSESIFHYSAGRFFQDTARAPLYLEQLKLELQKMKDLNPQMILYQAGVDVHVDDPLGGFLNGDQMAERDRLVFQAARESGVPIAWVLAGGYQTDPDVGIQPVLDLHFGTFEEACLVYGIFAKGPATEILSAASELYLAGEYEPVVTVCESWVKSFPHLLDFWKLLGVTKGAQGKHEEAYEVFLKAAEVAPRDGETLMYLIAASFNSNQPERVLNIIIHDVAKISWREQKVVAQFLAEAVRRGQVRMRELPEPLRTLASRNRSSKE